MKKLIMLVLLLLVNLLFGYPTLEELEQETGVIEREEPFKVREFSPVMNGIVTDMAISYGCYREGQMPGGKGPTKAEIKEDLQIISQYWNLIRLYNADDDTERILEVIRENGFEIKVMLGVWLEKEENDPSKQKINLENTARAIKLAELYPQQVIAINVGNETQVYWSWHRMKTENLQRYIRLVRKHTRIAVTTADDYNYWNKPESQDIAGEIDFILTHIYPLWNGKQLTNAISWLDSNYVMIRDFHPERKLILGEIGWATAYNAKRTGIGEQGSLIKGKVGIKAQEEFLTELSNWIKKRQVVTFYFEVFDELWKGGGETATDIEKNWGLYYTNRQPKNSFKEFIKKQEKLKEEQ